MMRRSLIAAPLMALLVAACGAGDGDASVAATVNDAEITTEDVTGLVYDTAVEPNAAQFAGYLGLLVQWKVVEQTAEADFGIVPSPEEVAAEIQQVLADFPFTGTLAEFLEQQNVSESAMRTYAAQLLIEERVEEELAAAVTEVTDAEAQQAIDDDPKAWTEVCAAHFLVATEAEATAAMARVEAGEAFADVASELSLDTGSGANGGDLGCASPAGYVVEFADATMTAPIDEMVGPIETQFGFHVIVVESRTAATVAEVRQALTDAAVTGALDTWFSDALGSAAIVITPEYGTWVTEPTPQVLPPG
jgi:parvulin-like peptidyl-prolyl isomerase